jgi:phosphatidylserine/phosphatidylglycerophosphate/cardiolipin synthase-like enzyme
MSELPLQPSLRPLSPRLRQFGALAALVGVALALGIASRPATPPPRLLSGGLDHIDSYGRVVDRLIRGAEHRVWVMLFVMYLGEEDDHPVNALCQALADARARGVDVRVVLDLGRDWETQEIDDKHESPVAWLRAHGVPVMVDELERTSHAKLVLVDDEVVVLGSHNWTRSALTANRETSLLLHDRRLLVQLEALFLSVPGFTALGGR